MWWVGVKSGSVIVTQDKQKRARINNNHKRKKGKKVFKNKDTHI